MSDVALRDFQPDPKAPARIRDTNAIRGKMLADRECRGCGEAASDGHHILFRSLGGDDVGENIAPLCHGCHMLFHNGVGSDAKAIAAEIGRNLNREEIAYLIEKLGRSHAIEYLRRHYGYSLTPKRKRRPAKPEVVVPIEEVKARRRARALARSRSQESRRRAHGRRR